MHSRGDVEAGCRLTDVTRASFDSETANTELVRSLAEHPDSNGADPGDGGTVEQHLGGTDRADLQERLR